MFKVPTSKSDLAFTFALSRSDAMCVTRARGLDVEVPNIDRPERWRLLFQHRLLLLTAVVSALFHFANAPMLLMLGQKLALANPGKETMLTSAAIMTAQISLFLPLS
jgi:hypothetical protein